MEITKGKIPSAQKIVVYGPEGIGKSTFASMFPNPVFIDTEGSTKYMDVARLPKPYCWSMLMDDVNYVYKKPDVCDTLIIDTADWAENLCSVDLCANSKKTGIEDFGYGKGYVYLAEEFGKLLNRLEEIVDLGVNVVFTAHAQMRKFEQPDEMGAYDRWEMKLQKKTAPLLKEWADAVFFINYQTYVVNVDGQGVAKGKNKAQGGGKRVMHTEHHSCWDAKNRYSLAPEVEFDYRVIAPFIPSKSGYAQVSKPDTTTQTQNYENKQVIEQHGQDQQVSSQQQTEKVQESQQPQQELIQDDLSGIPKALAALMQQNNVTLKEVQGAVAYKEYYPADTPFENYDPGFVSGVLIAAWQQVFTIIELLRSKNETPF